MAELHVHLCQHFLHALNRTARFRYQIAPVAPQSTGHPDLITRLKAVIQ